MITMKLLGGHGNQLFQWAFGLVQAKRLNTRLQLNTSALRGNRPFSLHQWTFPRIDVPYQTDVTVRELSMPYNPFFMDSVKSGDVIQGYFQTEKYFQGLESEIRSLLRPQVTDNGTLEKIYNATNPVAFHVRRGDYLMEPHKSFHGNLDAGYYQKALSYILERVSNPKIFVFSDDPEWCRSAFPQFDVVTPTQEAEDIYSMSQCKHAVIANSSFSWWGSWLGDDKKNRIVVAPRNWFQSKDEDSRDIVPERWVKI